MSQQNSHSNLQGAWSTLKEQWQETRSCWHDAVAVEFERQYWQEIEQTTKALARGAEKLDETLDQALHDTE